MANSNSLSLTASSTQFADGGDQTDFQFGTGDFTVMCWVKKAESGTDRGILSKCNGTSASGWILRTNNTDNFRIDLINTTIDQIQTSSAYSSTSVWYHITATRSGNTVTLYVNGISDGSGSSSKNVTSSGNNFLVGKGVEDTTYYWNGLLDEVRVYKGRALTGSEILSIYQSNIIDASLVAYWNLNNVYTDSSGNSHTLTPSGSPTFSSTVPFADYPSNHRLTTNSKFW